MTVKELINELEKCDTDDIVMYDETNTLKNMAYVTERTLKQEELHNPIDDVYIGTGTLKGFVYLSEKLL